METLNRAGRTVWILLLVILVLQQLTPTNSQNIYQCGRRKTSRIVGGYNALPNEYPMMAGLIYDRVLYCGAIILSQWHVVSAAHCFSGKRVSDIIILTGEHDINRADETPYAAVYRSAYVIVHSGYNGKEHDIAVLKSAEKIAFNPGVGSVCLPYGKDPFVGRYVEAAGWGTLGFGGKKATILQKVTLQVISNDKCSQSYRRYIPMGNICTYMQKRDACQMDSGGPLFLIEGGIVYLAGIIAFGTGCGGSAPGVATRVTEYADWIRANMY